MYICNVLCREEHEKHYALVRKRIDLYKKENVSEAVKLLNWLASDEAASFYPAEKVPLSKKIIWREQFDLLAPLEAAQIAKDIETGRMRLNSSDPLDRLIERVEVQNYSRELTEIIRNLTTIDSDQFLEVLMKRLLNIVLSDFCASEDLRKEYADELKSHLDSDCPTIRLLKYNLNDGDEPNESGYHGPKSVLLELEESTKKEDYEKVMKLVVELEKTLKKWSRAFTLDYLEDYTARAEKMKLRALIGLNYHEDALQLASKFTDEALLEPLLFEPILDVLEASHQLTRAIALIEAKLMTIDPEEPSLILRLADDLIEAKRFEEAAEYLQAIPEAYSSMTPETEARLAFATGLCAWNRSNRTPQSCLANFLSAAKLNPVESKYFAWIGKFYWRVEAERERALKCFTKALNLDANNLPAAILYAEASLHSGDNTTDNAMIALLLKPFTKTSEQSRNRRLFYYYGIALFHSSNFLEASVAFQSALKGSLHYEDSSDPPISDDNCLQWVGEAFLRSNRLGSAEKAFSRLASLQPASFVAQVGLAAVQLKSNNPIEAVDCLDSLVDIPTELQAKVHADKSQALLALARHYLRQGRFLSAIQAVLRCLKNVLLPCCPEILRMAADAMTLAHQFRTVQGFKVEAFTEFINLSNTFEINPGLEEISAKINENEELLVSASVKFALSALSEAFKEPSKHCLAAFWLQLAISLSKATELDGFAFSALENAIRSTNNPSLKAQAHHLQALLLMRDPQSKRQVQHHLIISLKFIETPQAWTDLGRFYLQAGDWELATEAFKRALAVDPEDLVAAFELARSSGTREGAAAAFQVAQRAFSTQPVHFTEDFALCLAQNDDDKSLLAEFAQIYLNRLHNFKTDCSIDEIPSFSTKLDLLTYLNSSEDPKIWSSPAAAEFDCEFLLKRPENEVTQSGWRAVIEGLLPSVKERTRLELNELAQ